MENQGKRKEQIEFSQKLLLVSIIGMLCTLAIIFLTKYY